MSTVKFDKWKSSSGAEEYFKCRAWVNFTGVGTVAIRDSQNISSVIDRGLGWYEPVFSIPMSNRNYAVSISGVSIDSTGAPTTTRNRMILNTYNYKVGSFMISGFVPSSSASSIADAAIVTMAVFE